MKTITYTFADGAQSAVEVSDELGAVIAGLEKETENRDRAETRRHTSLDYLSDRKDTEIADEGVDLETDCIRREDIATLNAGLETLTPSQRELVRKRFYEDMTVTAIAKEYGVCRQSIHGRVDKIFKKLRQRF